jgi:hypothetical protein
MVTRSEKVGDKKNAMEKESERKQKQGKQKLWTSATGVYVRK